LDPVKRKLFSVASRLLITLTYQGLSLTELAHRAEVDVNHTSREVTLLVVAGLVSKMRESGVTTLTLTSKGQRVGDALRAALKALEE